MEFIDWPCGAGDTQSSSVYLVSIFSLLAKNIIGRNFQKE